MFAHFGLKNLKIYYILAFLLNASFIGANWLFFYQEYLTNKQIGISESIAVFVGIISSIPSGALSDLWGKKNMLILAFLVQIAGVVSIISFRTYLSICIGSSLIWLGMSFFDCSRDPVVYDSLKVAGLEKHFPSIVSSFSFLGTVFVIITIFLGGILYKIDIVYPWIAWLVFLFLGFLVSLAIKEPEIDTYKFSLREYTRQLSRGFKNLISPNLLAYFVGLGVLFAIFRVTGEGMAVALLAKRFQFDGESFSYVISIVNIFSLFFIFNFVKVRDFFGDNKGVSYMLMGFALICILSVWFMSPVIGFLVLLFMILIGKISVLWSNVLINEKIPSNSRGTTLSTFAMLLKFPYAFAAPLIGALADASKLHFFYLGAGVLVLFAFVGFRLLLKNQK
jgi:MFS family permease